MGIDEAPFPKVALAKRPLFFHAGALKHRGGGVAVEGFAPNPIKVLVLEAVGDQKP